MIDPLMYRARLAPRPVHPMANSKTLAGEIFNCFAGFGVDQQVIATQLIAAASLVAQGTASVTWPNGQVSPMGASVLLVAPSGSGKTMLFRQLVEPIHLHMRESARQMIPGQRLPDYILEDATREAVIQRLLGWPVAAVFSDEAGQLNRLMSTGGPTFAKLMDGTPLHHARVSTGRATLTNHRFMLSLAEQPDVFQATKVLLGASNGGVGLVNRMTFGLGQTLPVGASLFGIKLLPNLQARYEQRVSALLESTNKLVHDSLERPALLLAQAAQTHLIDAGTQMRLAAQQDVRFKAASEYVSRHAERVLRFAGALHVFEHGPIGEVEVDTVETARQVDQLSIEAFLALTYEPPQASQADLDAERLQRELVQMAYMGQCAAPVAYLRRMSINLGLTKGRFDKAMAVLGGRSVVTVFIQNRQDWIRVNPPQLAY